MKDEELRGFVETVHLGEDVEFLYKNRKHFCQGWFKDGIYTLYIDQIDPLSSDFLWYKTGPDRDALADELLTASIFDGKSFWEVHDHIEWID